MKKVLVTVAALGLVAGFAANALALDKPGEQATVEATTAPVVATPTAPGVALWSVKGSWVLAGAYLSNGYGAPGVADLYDDGHDSADAFYIYSFKLLPTLQINDKIAMKGEFRFADRDVFGATDTAKILPNEYGEGGVSFFSDGLGGRVIDTYLLYMEWESPYGKTRFGRTPAGAWGSKFMDNAAQGNRIMWWPNMLPENWGALIFTQKIKEIDATNLASDEDQDGYYVDLSYKGDMGKTIGAIWLVRNANSPTSVDDPYFTGQARLYGNYNFEPMSLEYEVLYNFGDSGSGGDVSAFGVYADLGYKMQDWKLGGLAWYASGDDNSTDNDTENMMSATTGLGKDFNPFQILTGDYMNILNGDNPLAGDGIHPDIARAGSWAIQGYASYAMSPALSINGYLGYAAAVDEMTGYDSDYGMEAGIGFGYKLMDNLTYGAHFSYLWTGDYFKEGVATAGVEDVYLLANALSMSF